MIDPGDIDHITITPSQFGWRLIVSTRAFDGDGFHEWPFTIGDPGQFNEETRRTLGRWLAEDNLIRAAYAEPVEPQSIRADLEET